jgi:hypothetical protein
MRCDVWNRHAPWCGKEGNTKSSVIIGSQEKSAKMRQKALQKC